MSGGSPLIKTLTDTNPIKIFKSLKSGISTFLTIMTEKLCLQWNDYKENVNSAFGRLRSDKEFTDVTLTCEDGKQIDAHKVVLASSSPFFEEILQRSKNPHLMIYLKGFKSKDLVSILDFLYFGEANVYQEDLNSFLVIAEEIKLKGVTGQIISDFVKEQNSRPCQPDTKPLINALVTSSTALGVPNQSNTDLQALDEKVKSMMEKGHKKIQHGHGPNGTPKEEKSYICKVCGKEARSNIISAHIESNHLEGISIPCDFCDKTFSSRANLKYHRNKFHR